MIGLDVETTMGEPPRLLCVALGGRFLDAHTPEAAARAVAEVMRTEEELALFNAAFDLDALARAGLPREWIANRIREGRIHDAMILYQLLWLAEGGEVLAGGKLDTPVPFVGLQWCAETYLGEHLEKDLQTAWEAIYATGGPTEAQKQYVLKDAEAARRLVEMLLPRAQAYSPSALTEAVQIGAALALLELGRVEIPFDRERAERMLEEREREFTRRLANGPFVKGGHKCIKELREYVAGRVPLTPGGKPSTARAALLALKDDPRIREHLGICALEKEIGFLRNWLNRRRIRPRYLPLVATGRTSCRDPNLQQVPVGLKCLFGLGTELDYHALELRAWAAILASRGWPQLGEALAAGRDLHAEVSMMIFGDAAPEHRQLAKAANFGFAGGMGAEKFRATLAKSGVAITLEEAQRIRRAWRRLPGVEGWLQDPASGRLARYGDPVAVSMALRAATLDPGVRELVLSMELPEALQEEAAAGHGSARLEAWVAQRECRTLTGRVRAPVGYSEYLNGQFQGLAADGTKLALLTAWERGVPLRAFVHDSFCVPREWAPEMARIMTREMEALLGLPAPVETKET